MLKQLRSKKAMKRIMFWTLVLVIPSFVFFYGWQSSSQQNEYGQEYLARVKDRWWGLRWRELTQNDEYYARNRLVSQYGNIAQGMGLPEEVADKVRGMIGPQEIAHAAIDAYYLQRLAGEKGLHVTRDELRAQLQGVTPQQFKQFLRQRGWTESQYIAEQIYGQTLAKAEALVFSRAITSLFDLWQEYLVGQEKIEISYVRILRREFEEKVDATTPSLRFYYEENKEDYRIGERHEFDYVAVLRSDVEAEMEPTTDSVRQFYEENKENLFSRKRSVRVRHVFVQAGPTSTTAEVETAQKKIRDIADGITTATDFAVLANVYSEDPTNTPDPGDPSKKRGGLIPVPVREDSPSRFGEDFMKTALALEKDEISTPVRGTTGFHLIKADEVTTAGILTLEEVAARARMQLLNERTDDEFTSRGQALKNLFAEQSYSTLDAFAKAAELSTATTGLVDLQSGYIEKIGSIRESLEMLSDMAEGEFTEGVFKSYGAYYVMELVRKHPARVPDFVEVAADIRDDYVTSEAAHLAHQLAREMARDAKTSSALLQVIAEKHGYELTASEPFTRDEAGRPGSILPNLDPRFTYATLRYKVGTIHVTRQGRNIERPTAYVVWYFAKREPPTLDEFRTDLPQFRAEYLSQLQQALIQEWLHDQRRGTRAELNPVLKAEQEEEENSG